MGRALVIVDLQRDFCEGGALAVPGGEEVARRVREYLLGDRLAVGDYDQVAATYDWHDAPPSTNGGHFALPPAEPDFVDTWPPHCVAGTVGSQAALDLAPLDDLVMFFKGSGRPDYSGAQAYSSDGESLPEFLAATGCTEVDVVGLALDHCVVATALDLVTTRRSVRLLRDLTAPVDALRGVQAVTALQARGVAIETTGMDGWTGR